MTKSPSLLKRLWPWFLVALLSVKLVPIHGSFALVALYVLAVTIGLEALNWVLVTWHPKPRVDETSGHWGVLLYALPPLLAWGTSLLAFFPGLMSSDSIDEWHQATGVPVSDHHPILHILAERLLARVWQSPAVVAITQVVVLSLLVGWGCQSLRRAGIPRWVVLITCLVCSLSLPNVGLTVTLWKDVPYTAGVLALTILIFRFEELPPPIASPRFWLGVGLASLTTLSFRHNGIAAVVGTVLAFILLDRRTWKPVLIAALTAVVLQASLRIWAVRHYRAGVPATSLAVVGLLSAHVAKKTVLAPDEASLLSELRPLDEDWHYDCLTVNPTLFDRGFTAAALSRHDPEFLRLAVRLSLRQPATSLHHLACASKELWQVLSDGAYIDGPPIWIFPDGQVQTIDPGPDSPQPHSFLPGLRVRLAQLIFSSIHDGRFSWLLWRPALSLYLLIFCCAVACQRRRSWRPAAVILPSAAHTALLAAVILVQDLRYQYPVILVCQLFAPAFLFLPVKPAGRPVAEKGAGVGR